MPHRILKKILKIAGGSIPDDRYLKMMYRLEMGKKLDLDNPVTMNEKLQWLKIHNRKPELTELVDKLRAKDRIAAVIGREHIVPTLGVWSNPDDIDFDSLPDKFVLKTNHSGGNLGVVVCKDKSKLDIEAARAKMKRSLSKHDIYKIYREWPYKDVVPTVFAEQLLQSKVHPGEDIADYKFYCFNGNADCVLICVDRQIGDPKFYFFDRDWKLRRYNKRGKAAPADFTLPRPENLDKMFDIASQLSKGFPMVRVDLYNIDGRIYFGELTFFPASGFDYNRLPETDRYFGDLIDLSIVK